MLLRGLDDFADLLETEAKDFPDLADIALVALSDSFSTSLGLGEGDLAEALVELLMLDLLDLTDRWDLVDRALTARSPLSSSPAASASSGAGVAALEQRLQ